jgi:hypothetical protein
MISSNVSAKRARASAAQQSPADELAAVDLRRSTITLPASAMKSLKKWGIDRDLTLNDVFLTTAHEFLVRNKLPGVPGMTATAETTPTPPALLAPRKPKRSTSRPKNPTDASGSGGEPHGEVVPHQGGTLPPG